MISKRAAASFLLLAVAAAPASAFVAPASRGVAWGTSSAVHMSSVATVSEALASHEKAMDKMKAKDKTSKALSKQVSFRMSYLSCNMLPTILRRSWCSPGLE